MSFSLVRVKRKISCVACRKKKVSCDGETPCQRCINRKTPEECKYVKPGQAGRPPKNAVINKLILNRSHDNNNISNLRSQFIFETVGYVKPTDSIFINDDSSKNLCYFINTLFNNDDAVMQIAVVRVSKAIPYLPEIKITSLEDLFLWTTSENLNVLINRLSAVPLDNFNFVDAISAAVFQEMALKYFSEPPLRKPLGNPLTLMPSENAVHLIHTFFTVSPHALILNKSLLLQGYWTDSMDPLLLSVVYGTTIYMSRLLEGRPLGLWEAVDDENRNVYLDYAFALIQKSSSEVSFAKYQAVVLLGLFEIVFGHTRRALSILGLAFVIGFNLGVSDGTFQAKTDDIQAELANTTLWALISNASRGAVEVGQTFHATKTLFSVPLPPPTLQLSRSYEFEQVNGDDRHYGPYSFLVESFYVYSVFSRYTIMILLELPEVRYNMFAPRLGKKQLLPRHIGYPKPHDLVPRLRCVLRQFNDFIRDTKHTWSKQQTYALEMSAGILEVHVVLIKDIGPVMEGVNYANSAYDFFQETRLVPDDPMTMARIEEALPMVHRMMDKTEEFLSDPVNYNLDWNQLPRGLIVTVLETAMETLFIKCLCDPWNEVTFDYLKAINAVTQLDIWRNWSAIQTVRARLNAFFEGHGSSSTGSPTTMADSDFLTSDSWGLFDAWDPSTTTKPWNDNTYPTTVSFFDPCAKWVNPMRNVMVDLRPFGGPGDMHNVPPENPSSCDTPTIDPGHQPVNHTTGYENTLNVPDHSQSLSLHSAAESGYSSVNSLTPASNDFSSPGTSHSVIDQSLLQGEVLTPPFIPRSTPPVIQHILFDEDPFL